MTPLELAQAEDIHRLRIQLSEAKGRERALLDEIARLRMSLELANGERLRVLCAEVGGA